MDKEGKMMIFCLLLAGISSPVFSDEWKASVIKHLDALMKSCVVIPCSFTYPGKTLPSSRLRGIWHYHKNIDKQIYQEDKTQVLENFRDRTQLLGQLGQKNCTLEISDIKDHDNGPFCFRVELAENPSDKSTPDKYSFNDDCINLRILTEPPKPTLTYPQIALQDHHYSAVCSVIHTCPSHWPTIVWNKGTASDVTEVRREIKPGTWELQSILTIIPEEKDDHSEITCTARFHGKEINSTAKLMLFVKRTVNYNYIIIPTVVGIGTAIIFGALCIFMVKKYKRRITELQNQDGSMWNRLSRLSRRIRSNGPRPSRNDQRPSNVKISKPRFPSPKSQPKSCNYNEDYNDGDDYMNTADLNVYGNF